PHLDQPLCPRSASCLFRSSSVMYTTDPLDSARCCPYVRPTCWAFRRAPAKPEADGGAVCVQGRGDHSSLTRVYTEAPCNCGSTICSRCGKARVGTQEMRQQIDAWLAQVSAWGSVPVELIDLMNPLEFVQ